MEMGSQRRYFHVLETCEILNFLCDGEWGQSFHSGQEMGNREE